MRQFFIFSIFVCFAAANVISREHPESLEQVVEGVKECARDFNVNLKDVILGQGGVDKYPNGTWCMLACSVRKMMSKEVTVSDPMTTLYNGFMKIIQQAYENGYQEIYDSVKREEQEKFTRESVTNDIEKCYASEKNECDFFKCSKFYTKMLEMLLRSGLHAI